MRPKGWGGGRAGNVGGERGCLLFSQLSPLHSDNTTHRDVKDQRGRFHSLKKCHTIKTTDTDVNA